MFTQQEPLILEDAKSYTRAESSVVKQNMMGDFHLGRFRIHIETYIVQFPLCSDHYDREQFV